MPFFELNGKELLDSRLAVEYAKQSERRDDRGGGFSSRYGRPYNTEFRVLIENVSSQASWQDLKDYFRQAGEVTFAKCHRERMGEGVVEFASAKDMENALRKLDGTELYGKRLKLRCENPNYSGGRSPAPRGRSPSRSPPRRRSYSRSPQGSRSRS